METLESSRICRLCGKQSGISINIFDKNESHVKKINAILPVMVHEMDLLPKHMCHRCSYKLEEFHKFYVDCLKTDADLKSQLSWMRKENSKETIGVPMVHIENVKMKLEPPDYDVYEMNPMVDDNVNYINSVSSVTFPVNGIQPNGIPEGITYTAYARCACYCDKTDQSNQTVCTNYKNTIPRCNRVKNVTSDSNGCSNELQQAVKKNVLANKSHRKRSNYNLPTRRDKCSANKELSTSIIVRNLRPRKGFIDYTGTKKKQNPVISSRSTDTKFSIPLAKFPATQIKVEPFHGVEGRTLRPRKGTIDYIGPKRKYSKFIDTNQRSQQDDKYHRSIKKQKVRNIANKLKIPMKKLPILLENTIKLGIKEEQQLPDPEDTLPFHESVSATLSRNCERRRDTIRLASKIDSLPNDFVANVQNSRIDGSLLNPRHPNIIVDRLRKIGSNRIAPINYPPKYLTSQHLYLRSGKMKKFDNIQLSSRKLLSLGNITNNSQTVGTNLMKTIRGINTSKKMSASLIDNIKRYCEECNTSFFNRELFKLHACYH